MRFRSCKRCNMLIVEMTYKGLTEALDPCALSPAQIGHAWLARASTYRVHTLHREQWASYYPPTPRSIQEVTEWITSGQAGTHTVLATHQCPGQIVHRLDALDTWKPNDARPHLPQPTPAHSEGVPF